MKTTITVSNRREGEQIRAGLDDPNVRAFVKIMGIMRGLPSDRARQMVLSFVHEANAAPPLPFGDHSDDNAAPAEP